jgi:hypothetical protein
MSELQTTDAFPIEKPSVTPEKRLEHAKKMLESVVSPPKLPSDFDPLQATPEELQSYGLPPRPDSLDQEAKWEKLMAEMKKAELITPEFEIIQRDKIPVKVNVTGDAKERNWTGDNWAGAVILASRSRNFDQAFHDIQADWTVPDPVPGKDIDEETGKRKGKSWYSSAWIGIDGWTSSDVLQGGTGHDVFVSKEGKLSKDIYAWYEWYPAYPIRLKNFIVSAGDRVSCSVWATDPTTGHFFIYNWDTWKYAEVTFHAPKGIELQGDSAEWIVEDPEDRIPVANFKVIEFDCCWALRGDKWEDLTNALPIVSATADGTFCTAKILPPTTLVVTYHNQFLTDDRGLKA